MKKTFTLFILLAILSGVSLAQVPNGGFESWIGNEPAQWSTNNIVSNLSGADACTMGTPAPEGNSFMQLTSYFEPAIGMPSSAYAVCGYYDYLNNATSIDGFPYTQRPDYLSGVFKYQAGSDMGAVVTYMTKWNTTTNSRDTVGTGQLIFNPVTDWTNFNVLINYTLPEFPDSCVLVFISSISFPELGATLSVDALNLSNTPLSTDEIAESSWTIFPNPVEDILNVTYPNDFGSMCTMTIVDAMGRVVMKETNYNESQTRISLQHIPAGVYTLLLETTDKRLTKLIIKK